MYSSPETCAVTSNGALEIKLGEDQRKSYRDIFLPLLTPLRQRFNLLGILGCMIELFFWCAHRAKAQMALATIACDGAPLKHVLQTGSCW